MSEDTGQKILAALERLAETLDVLVMAHDEQTQVIEEVRDLLDEDAEPPVSVRGKFTIPGFPADPLEGFPSIRKEEK